MEEKMGKRTDIHKVLIIGSGPIIIGQACEFDYSGTQACKALRSLGYEIVLVNSNPATIMTDPGIADVTYIEPLNVKRLEQIIKKERPDAILPNLGGQSGLNLCSELAKEGILEQYQVKVIGVQVDAIERGEDRIEFKNTMNSLGIEMARSEVAYSVEDALGIAEKLGYPVVLRPAYTMGGAGGGLVYNVEELKTVCARGLQASLVGQVLVEESILGWEELELEVVRDAKNNMITVCFIENIDPLGVHTGDSFCSAPMLTISEEVQKRLQEQAYRIVEAIEVIGGTNVQFAHDPVTDRIVVIEINPRTSRSSALASKATGFPIALVSAMLASGLTLDEIPCGKYGTLDRYVPDGDYIVIKFARWAFEKFKGVEDKLGTQMRAVGEVMSIGKTYKEAFQKAIRSLEIGRYGLGFAKDFAKKSKEELLNMLYVPTSERQFIMYEALRKGATVEELYQLTKIKHYFIEQMKELVEEEEALLAYQGQLPPDSMLTQAKKNGFSDKYLGQLLQISEKEIRDARTKLGVVEAWEEVHVSGTKDSAYYYSTYHGEDHSAVCGDKPKIMILGGGPNRIGQGIEFDYCSVHAALALKKLGFETIIVNCNPETVSTDYDTSDKLYFEPLTLEDVLSIYQKEKPLGIIAQFGGQTPLNLSAELEQNGVKILGTSPAVIDLAEDRDLFRAMMEKLEIPKDLKDLLDYIKSREYEICIKDLTVGNSVPVLGLLVFNKKRTKYSFSIGSDIEIDICLQRCITEMFQGEDFKFSFRHKMKEIWGRYSCKSVVWSDREKSHEYTKALVDKSGYLPIRFVLSEKERPDIPSVFKPIKTNKGAFEYHLSICNKNGWDVLIKDFSWSGFPSYRVYIPKISEAFYVPADNWLKGIEDIKDIKKSWLELNTCNAERKAELIASIERVYSMERYRCNSVSANKLFGVIIDTDDIRYNYLRFFDELLYALYWETGKIDKAFEMLESAILSGDLQKRFMDNLSNALNSSEKIESMADKFVFPNCPECSGCGIQNVCRYNEYKRIFEYMQDAMKGK